MAKKDSHKRVNDTMELLRKEAEKIMSGTDHSHDPHLAKMDFNDLLHNVQVQQIELEMQNDELKISNEELELQRARFAGLFDLAPVGYFILNQHGVVQQVNSTGRQLLNVATKNILHKRFQSFVSADEGALFSSFLHSLKYTDKHNCQVTMQTTTGETFYAQIQGIATQTSIGEQGFYIGVIDISDKINNALKLTHAYERLNIALSASAAGTWEIDLKTGEIYLDDYSQKIFGFRNNQFDGRADTFLQIIHPEDRDEARKRLLFALSRKTELDIDYRVVKSDKKTCYVSIRVHVVYLGNQMSSFVGIVMDIDHKKQLEKEAQLLKISQDKSITAATLQAQENERKRISEALHDSVSQLLYGIKLNLQNNDSSKVNELLELAIHESRNIAFELAPAVLTDFGLAVTINEMCKRLTNSQLNIKAVTQGFKQRLDAATEMSIFRIIQELVNNGIKHAEATEINISLVKKNTSITITVNDNGKGFVYHDDEAYLNGSGLASIKNRLTLFNGSLQIDSTPATGTNVVIILKDIKNEGLNNG